VIATSARLIILTHQPKIRILKRYKFSKMSVITLALIATFTWGNNLANLQSFDLQIGGMNASEYNDMTSFAPPVTSTVREAFGAFSANWLILDASSGSDRMGLLSSPPIKHAAPFLSRVKTWGYQITFYQSYQEKQEIFRQSCVSVDMTPSLVHSWILEKESDLVILPPPPPTTPTVITSTNTIVTSTTEAATTSLQTTIISNDTTVTTTQIISTSSRSGSSGKHLHALLKAFFGWIISLSSAQFIRATLR